MKSSEDGDEDEIVTLLAFLFLNKLKTSTLLED